MIPLCLDQGVGCIPWSPLARGVLAGNRTRDGGPAHDPLEHRPLHRLPLRPADRLRRRRCRGRGRRGARDVPPAQVALAWLLAKPGVSAPIVGATKKKHLKDALAAEALQLSEDEMAALEKPYVPHPVLGHF